MKFRFDEDLSIIIDEALIGNRKMDEDTPHYAFLQKRVKSDLKKKLGCLNAVLNFIKEESFKPVSYLDLMSGCGFVPRLLIKRLQPEKTYLNDIDKTCCKILRKNFPGCEVFNRDAKGFPWNKILHIDLILIDFNTFTINHIADWHAMLFNIFRASPYVIMIDTACYAYRFGDKSFGGRTIEEYYDQINKDFYAMFDHSMVARCGFSNATYLLFVRGESSYDEPKVLDSIPMEVIAGDKKGFFL